MPSEYIKLIRSNCKNCHKCIRNCPVKSIRFIEGRAEIIPEECLLCGQCFIVCPQKAKEIRSDVAAVKARIAAGETVYASLAPSFVANYSGATIRSMEKALSALGFAAVEETAIGATMVKNRYEELIAEHKPGREVLISSCCPVVNDFIRMYHPEVLPQLADVATPAEAHCRAIKSAHPQAVTVFIGPCIAKKKEADNSKAIDYALTFDELTHWLGDESVMLLPEKDELQKSRARLFPTSGGVLRTMHKDPDWIYITIDGMDNCKRAIKEIAKGELKHCFIEMSACAGSCVGGPVMEKMRLRPIHDNATINAYAGREDFDIVQPSAAQIKVDYPGNKVRRLFISETDITATLRHMGKLKPEDELNCGFCGYDTCRDKAIAVCLGKAEYDMCLPFLMKKAQSFSDAIIKNSPNGVMVLNESLEIQQLNAAACAVMNIKNPADVCGEQVVSVLDPGLILKAVHYEKSVRNEPVYLAEYKRYVEETVVHDKANHIIIVLLSDITRQEAARTKRDFASSNTIEVADKVIENQMRVVQEIASLLGETAAETKIALTKLKESLENNE